MTPKEQSYEILANTLIKKMEKRQFEACYCPTKEEALEKVKSYFTKGCSITCGGSVTLSEIGFKDFILSDEASDYSYINRDLAKSAEAKREIFSQAALADYYLMSSNAITLDGELVNIDGSGNRVAALCFGPSNVIIVAGMNKVAPDFPAAVARVRGTASAPNALRLNCKTPCAMTGVCGDCLSPDCICAQIVTTRFSRIPGRIKVILVGEELGF
ncbi:MAG: lactate utilization protein [Lachnospiraceae bacterium]|nr:lactate utilization protein [Lachnospiraceae bacterium]